MISDKYFSYFLSKFPMTSRGPECTQMHHDQFRGRLPDSLLAYWQEFGFSGFGDGLVWMTDPIEWKYTADYLTIGLSHPDLGLDGEYIPFARTAFGKVYFWTPGFGHSLTIEPMYGNAEFLRPPQADPSNDTLRSFFAAATSESLQRIVTPSGVDCQLFQSVYDRLGHLSSDKMYAFVPSLGVGGPLDPEVTVVHGMHVHLGILKDFAGDWDTSGMSRGSTLSRNFFDWLRTQPGEDRVSLRAWLDTLSSDAPVVRLYDGIDLDSMQPSRTELPSRVRDSTAPSISTKLSDLSQAVNEDTRRERVVQQKILNSMTVAQALFQFDQPDSPSVASYMSSFEIELAEKIFDELESAGYDFTRAITLTPEVCASLMEVHTVTLDVCFPLEGGGTHHTAVVGDPQFKSEIFSRTTDGSNRYYRWLKTQDPNALVRVGFMPNYQAAKEWRNRQA